MQATSGRILGTVEITQRQADIAAGLDMLSNGARADSLLTSDQLASLPECAWSTLIVVETLRTGVG